MLAFDAHLTDCGVKDILIACVDGLKGFPDAIQSVYSDTQIQLCIVHMVRNSIRYVPFSGVSANVQKLDHTDQELEDGVQSLL